MIIGIIGELCSGKHTLTSILKEIDPNIIVLNSINDKSKEKKSSKTNLSIEHRLEQIIDSDNTWLENHKKVTEILKSNTATIKTNEIIEKQLDSLNIKDQVRNQQESIIILNLQLNDFKLLQNKATFRLVRIETSCKNRFNNFKTKYNNTSFEDFLNMDDKSYCENELINIKSTTIYTILNNSNLEAFKSNIKDFWFIVNSKFRPSWDDYFMNVALHVADRASCVKLKVGAVIVNEKRIVSTGFNGTPINTPHCFDGFCPRCHKNNKQGENMDSCYCIHAEENAIIEVGREKSTGGVMYVTFLPCLHCTKLIINSGIKKVYYLNDYNSDYSLTLFNVSKVEVVKFDMDKLIFNKQ